MPLELHPAEENDAEACAKIEAEAFRGDLMTALFPNGYQQADHECTTKRVLEDLRKHEENSHLLKIIDTDLPGNHEKNRIVGVAHWVVHPEERTEADLDKELEEFMAIPPSPNSNKALRRDFHHVSIQCKRQIMGMRPHVHLAALMVDPAHQRRGVGSMLVDWGLKKADELQLPAFVESTPKGRPLYLSKGFELVREMPFDTSNHGNVSYGGDHWCLVRPARQVS